MKYLPVLVFLFASCTTHDENQAGVGMYYFVLDDKTDEPAVDKLFTQVFDGITDVDYFLAEESAAKGWPFYGEVSKNQKVAKSDLMPPHTWVHRLVPISEFAENPEYEHVFKSDFIVYQFSDTLIEIGGANYAYENGLWDHLITTTKAVFNPEDFDDQSQLVDSIRKTLIRDTFK